MWFESNPESNSIEINAKTTILQQADMSQNIQDGGPKVRKMRQKKNEKLATDDKMQKTNG